MIQILCEIIPNFWSFTASPPNVANPQNLRNVHMPEMKCMWRTTHISHLVNLNLSMENGVWNFSGVSCIKIAYAQKSTLDICVTEDKRNLSLSHNILSRRKNYKYIIIFNYGFTPKLA